MAAEKRRDWKVEVLQASGRKLCERISKKNNFLIFQHDAKVEIKYGR